MKGSVCSRRLGLLLPSWRDKMLTSLTCFLCFPIGSIRRKLVTLLPGRCYFTANLNISFPVMTSASLSQNKNFTSRLIPFYHLVCSRWVSVAAPLHVEIALKYNSNSYSPAPSPTLHPSTTKKRVIWNDIWFIFLCSLSLHSLVSHTIWQEILHFLP